VFSSSDPSVFLPESPTNPINLYGISKELGERLLFQENPDSIVLRTSGLYGGLPYMNSSQRGANNFVNKILRRLLETEEIVQVIQDQFFAPTSSKDLIDAVKKILRNEEKYL
jgi:dTDP-4-dehydrorhamnose reductase